jgi:hypothetical protein
MYLYKYIGKFLTEKYNLFINLFLQLFIFKEIPWVLKNYYGVNNNWIPRFSKSDLNLRKFYIDYCENNYFDNLYY